MTRKQQEGRRPLGRASTATQGTGGLHMEFQGLWTKTGLSDR